MKRNLMVSTGSQNILYGDTTLSVQEFTAFLGVTGTYPGADVYEVASHELQYYNIDDRVLMDDKLDAGIRKTIAKHS